MITIIFCLIFLQIFLKLLLLQAGHLIIAPDMLLIYLEMLPAWRLVQYIQAILLKSAVPHDNDILYVFITQSGETSDTNSALRKAKEFGMRTLCITNKKDSTIWQASDFKVDCCAGEKKVLLPQNL